MIVSKKGSEMSPTLFIIKASSCLANQHLVSTYHLKLLINITF